MINNRQGIDALPTWKVDLLEQKQKNHEMEEKIYYINKHDGSRACVVLLVEGKEGELELVARGISICSRLDTFDRIKGRVIARGRAFRAIKKKHMTGRIKFYRKNYSNNQALQTVWSRFTWKSAYRPEPTYSEKKILAFKRKPEEDK